MRLDHWAMSFQGWACESMRPRLPEAEGEQDGTTTLSYKHQSHFVDTALGPRTDGSEIYRG
jgi:hypothetical protein